MGNFVRKKIGFGKFIMCVYRIFLPDVCLELGVNY